MRKSGIEGFGRYGRPESGIKPSANSA